MRKALALLFIFCITSFIPSLRMQAAAQDDQSQDQQSQDQQSQDQQSQDQGSFFDANQLDNLVAPIALYPDPLLAQVLVAATFPDQIDEADRDLRGGGYDIDDAPWDVSVKAVAHYPSVLRMMANKIDWTTSLGQAYVNQSSDVMSAVQRLRHQARDAGYLVTNPQQEVVYNDDVVSIYPAQPRYIYVPVYDPAVVYVRRPGFFGGPVITFGAGFAIGAWLNHDFDWHAHRVFYHGWEHGGGWIERSRPYVHVTNVYVNNNYRTVVVNRTVINRTVNYRELNHYNYVHRDVDYSHVRENHFDNRNQSFRDDHSHDVNNRILNRNINTNDARIDANRGHWTGNQNDNRNNFQQQQLAQQRQAQLQQQQRMQQNSAFHGNQGGFDARQASQRGQQSRQFAQNNQPQYHPSNNQPSGGHGGHENNKHK